MEQIIIVDENDEVIGSKEREAVLKDDIYRATGLWIENSKGQALLAQRSFSKKNASGKWGPAVSGTVEVGESYDSNIQKEAQEEIGLSDCEFNHMEKVRIRGEHNYFAQWYFRDIEDFVFNNEEVENLKWFGRDELTSVVKNNPEIFVAGFKQPRNPLSIFLNM